MGRPVSTPPKDPVIGKASPGLFDLNGHSIDDFDEEGEPIVGYDLSGKPILGKIG